jgi:hypothetical protein
MLALGVLHFEGHAETLRGRLHALGRSHPINFVGFSGIDERDGLGTGNRTAQQNGCTYSKA